MIKMELPVISVIVPAYNAEKYMNNNRYSIIC